MAVTTLPIEDIDALAGRIQSEAASLEATLNTLRQQCAREASFTGAAANSYDEFLARWDSNQRGLLDAIHGAGRILANLASTCRSYDEQVATQFHG